MLGYDFFLIAHILILVYWLGGDLGVFYSSGFVVDEKLSTEARLTAAKIMLGCDLVPKICMTLTLTVGGILAHYYGFEHPAWQLGLILTLAPVWLTMVLVLHFKHDAWYQQILQQVDFYFRWLVVGAVLGSTVIAYNQGQFADQPWLALKLIGFAALVLCGLLIRIHLVGFSRAYAKLLNGTQQSKDNVQMQQSLAQVRPWVITIWGLLLLETYLGVAKPML